MGVGSSFVLCVYLTCMCLISFGSRALSAKWLDIYFFSMCRMPLSAKWLSVNVDPGDIFPCETPWVVTPEAQQYSVCTLQWAPCNGRFENWRHAASYSHVSRRSFSTEEHPVSVFLASESEVATFLSRHHHSDTKLMTLG